jgi:glutamate racemase
MLSVAPPPDAPLLVFDSGVGGLSVLRPILDLLPQAPIIYAADFAGLPYGEKSEIEVATRVCAMLGRLTERYRPRLIIIACNTASTIALAHVRSVLEVPVVGTVPAIKPAALATQTGVIALLGTGATIRQPYVDRLEAEFATGKLLIRHAAPELVAPAEAKMRGEATDPAISAEVVAALLAQHPRARDIDQLILGCTHFPLVAAELAAAFTAALGRCPDMVDGGAGIARRVAVLTAEQAWPATAPQRLAVFNGDPSKHAAYAPALARYGIDVLAAF